MSDLDRLNASLSASSFRAGWNKVEPSLWKEPRTHFVRAHWRWADAKAALDRAGALVSAELADRRILLMVNPHDDNYYATLRTLVAAYQMILPGERAPSHRHSPHALRFVLDVADGAYTVVNGVRIDMRPGDVLLTPGWCWHGHANEGTASGYWIDVLDVPTVQLLETMFFDRGSGTLQEVESATRRHAFVFSWEETERALRAAIPDSTGRHGARTTLEHPGWMPGMSLQMERVSRGFQSRPYQTTANQIVCVHSGEGTARVGRDEFVWERGDVFAIPSWHPFSLAAASDAVLFRVSDESMQRLLHYYREADAC